MYSFLNINYLLVLNDSSLVLNLQSISHWVPPSQNQKIDLKIIRIRNIIILQFVEHKHDVWWTISQFRPTFLLTERNEREGETEKLENLWYIWKSGEKQKVILQQQDFSILHETSNFLYKMKSFWKIWKIW